LHCCRHQELVSGTFEAPQPQSIELQYAFEMCEQHLDLLAVLARLRVGGSGAYSTCDVARVLVDAARDLPVRRVGAAALFIAQPAQSLFDVL
jgi:hypothetical protein